MVSWWSKYQLGQYEKVHESENVEKEELSTQVQAPRFRAAFHLLYWMAIIGVTICTYQLSWLNFKNTNYYGVEPMRSSLRLKTSPYVFEPNMTFVMAPSRQDDEAWKSLMPLRRGFFIHPTLAPKVSAVAVFHHIHCLGLLREAMYDSRPDLASQGELRPDRRSDDHEDLNHQQSAWHIGHCFDIIRQALMCQPDLTIELADEKTKDVDGYGIEHQCINWEELLDWMKKYE